MHVKVNPLQTLSGHEQRVWHISFSPKGDMLASCGGDRTVRLWVPSPAGQYDKWTCSAILEHFHTKTIRQVCWSPDGSRLATASFDSHVAVWEVSGGTWEQVAELEGHENEVKGVAWSPDGAYLATCGRDRSIWIWESLPGHEFECVDVKQGHSQDIKCVAWHPLTSLADTKNGSKNTKEIGSVANKEEGLLLVSASYDDTLKLWRPEDDGSDDGAVSKLSARQARDTNRRFGPPPLIRTGDDWRPAATIARLGFGVVGSKRLGGGEAEGGAAAEDEAAGGDEGKSMSEGDVGPYGFDRSKVWKCTAVLSGFHERTIYSVAWNRSGKLLATGDGDNHVKIFAQPDDWYPESTDRPISSMRTKVPEAPSTGCCRESSPSSAAGCCQDQDKKGKADAEGMEKEERETNRMEYSTSTTEIGEGAHNDSKQQHTCCGGGACSGTGQAQLNAAQQVKYLSNNKYSMGPEWELVSDSKAAGHAQDVNCVTWHPNNDNLLASAGDDGLIKLWRIEVEL
eukprot:CAMPEP_0175057640 /NCGR_PEP_ID=MMETSP0052_2-20121109/11375_1 /TAXON_ID=51329 ORGANISM="Polytomella parva, Strain SAG 63-3" /NCGR_SAMPLE_ID=MMETSP0052_2 /ASSEMBLY_ACC=CAM_ASM_000194 /LENGTH=510 /DNA_ID=CAMNT_0016322873 /DNA_START=1 /DNA_END=1537 /DNA_ORIENTATION=-